MNQTILIAEDDPYLRDAYERRFRATEYEIQTVENGEQALAAIEKNPPGLFICDIMMPKLDGWGVLAKLAKLKHDFPVIMLTNLDDNETRARLNSYHVYGHLVKKNMTLASLLEMVTEVFRKDITQTPQAPK